MSETDKQPKAGEPEIKNKTKNQGEPKAPKEDKQPKAGEPINEMERWRQHFAKQPKVRIMIPREKTDPVGAFETVQINGYTFRIIKGEYVEVPEQIAQIIMDSQQQTEQAIANALKKIPEDERMVFDNSNS